jgi:hypothetical protein
MARKPTDTVQLNLRFSESLRRRLERAADANNRSMNAEIVHILERWFRGEDFRETQHILNEGMLKIMAVCGDVLKQVPAPKGPFLSDLAKYLPKAQDATQESAPIKRGEDSK